MGKIFGSLFKGDTKGDREPETVEVEYNGYRIVAAPRQANGQWQVAGRIVLETEGTLRQHEFVRADHLSSREDAADFTVRKAKLMIDQQGERIFG
ncbi:Transcriptional activator HlyU [Polymorphum gilvum SL003B-26A1]|uniref:Transcriptional activator HlyU n=1 Tax=Polymorphum gilvum (strain LMG 25793 / CGMCC 1.9160 / SL003B-26A1) TaxID=991905 RepID=F2J0H2_POLGS|nr:Transcriptional activator HlyU [Polymorphum gilvum SL003B-26A1]